MATECTLIVCSCYEMFRIEMTTQMRHGGMARGQKELRTSSSEALKLLRSFETKV